MSSGHRERNPTPGKNSLGQGIAASKVYANAGLGKLSSRFARNGGYRPADPDLEVRRFVMPRYEALDEARRQQYSEARREQEECDALIQHLGKDNARRYHALRDREKGDDVNAQRARRRRNHLAEVDRAKAMKAALSAKVGNESDSRFYDTNDESLAIVWGPPPASSSEARRRKAEEKQAEIDRRYEIDHANGRRYFLDGQLAFILRLRTLEVFSRKRRVQIDALKMARLMFRKVRFAARHAMRVRLARIAAELKIPIGEPVMDKVGLAHSKNAIAGLSPQIVASADRFEATSAERARLRASSKAAKRSRPFEGNEEEHARTLDIEALVAAYDAAQVRAEKAMQPPPFEAAQNRLKSDIDHDALLLCSSRQVQHREGVAYRFLDDAQLRRHFREDPEMLIDPQIQDDLSAIEMIQRAKRRWIAAAIVADRAKVENGNLIVDDPSQSWAKNFWKAQGADPTFRRLIAVARARPERFAISSETLPVEMALDIAKKERPYLARRIGAFSYLQERR